MKRFKGKLISVFLVVSFLLSIFTINVSATSEEYNTVAHHHFAKLTSHIPENVNGSCSYVAASLLLSFYDSYWHDDIIAEYYEYTTRPSSSPNNAYPNGAAMLKTEDSEWSDYEEKGGSYSNFIYSSNSNGKLIDQYFHLYLLSLGIAQGFYEGGANSESFGTTFVELATVLDLYFDLRFGPNDYVLPYGETNEDIPFNIHILYEFSPGSSREAVLQIIEEQVTSGNPVLYRGARPATEDDETENANESNLANDGKEAHAMVAYNVDDAGVIDLHTGYGIGSHSKYPGTDYNLNIGVLWIEINEDALPHSCSSNYRWVPTDSYVCSCIAYKDMHPAHEHEDSGDLLRRDATTHTYECIWGDEITELHSFTSCNNPTNTSHIAVCKCGYSTSKAHVFTYESISSLYHISVCACGYTTTGMHTTRAIDNRYSACTLCGEVFDSWSDNTIFKVEEDIPQEQE